MNQARLKLHYTALDMKHETTVCEEIQERDICTNVINITRVQSDANYARTKANGASLCIAPAPFKMILS